MRLSQLISDLPFLEKRNFSDVEIRGLASHTDGIQAGDLFIAIHGTKVDGHHFIDNAIAKGASALIVERDLPISKKIPIF